MDIMGSPQLIQLRSDVNDFKEGLNFDITFRSAHLNLGAEIKFCMDMDSTLFIYLNV